MPWCPQCKVEYRKGFTICHDCEIDLVENIEDIGKGQEMKKPLGDMTKVVISILVFLPLWLIINILFGYNNFFGAGVFKGADLIYWQNRILNASILIMFGIFICMLVRKRKLVTLGICFILIPIIGFACFNQVKNYYSEFTIDKWQNHRESRYLMYEDMLRKNPLVDKSFGEVENILGKSDSITFNKGRSEPANSKLYIIHNTSWLVAIHIQYLVVYVNDDGYVQNYAIHEYSE